MGALTRAFTLGPVLVLLWGTGGAVVSAQEPGTLAPFSSLNEPRARHTATLLPDGRVAIIGGVGTSGGLATAEIYDPATGSTSSLPSPLPAPLSEHTATLLDDGTVLIAGGRSGSGQPLASALLFDPASLQFRPLPAMTSARTGHSSTLLGDGRVLLAGGDGGAGPLASMEIFDPAAGAFVAAGPLLTARYGHAAVLLSDGRVLFAGGRGAVGPLRAAEIWDPGTGTSTPAASLGAARARPAATRLLDDTVLVVGGESTQGEALGSAERYDAAADTFVTLSVSLGEARSAATAVRLADSGKVLVAGGTGAVVPAASLELYDPVTQTFSVVGAPSPRRTAIASTFLAAPMTGVAILWGGADASGAAVASAEAFHYPTLRSDKTDYAPGETVTFSGERWLPGETVTITLQSSSGAPEAPIVVTADEGGAFRVSQFALHSSDVGTRFIATAAGDVSRWTAQATFSDGNVRVKGGPVFSSGFGATLTINNFSNNLNCTGSSTTTTHSVSSLNFVTFSVASTDSVEFQAPPIAQNGGAKGLTTFKSWTSPTGDPFTVLQPPCGVCIPGPSGIGNHDYIVNYGPNAPPSVSAGASSVTVGEGSTATLTGTFGDPDPCDNNVAVTASYGTITQSGQNTGTWSWSSFEGDGPSSRTVTIVANDGHGGVSQAASFQLIVNNVPPTVTLSGPTTGTEGSTVTLTVAASDVPADTPTLALAWTVTKNGGAYASGTGSTITFLPDDNGTYVVVATATDKDQGVGSASATVIVANVAPTATILGAPDTSPEGTAIELTSSVSDPGIIDTQVGFVLAWTVLKNGSAFASGSGASFAFTPDDNGVYAVTLQATDKDGATGESTRTITVFNLPPHVALLNAPSTSPEGTTVSLAAAASDPGPADVPSLDIEWTVEKDGVFFASGSGTSFAFTPDDNASYLVTVTATDKDGASASDSATITVTNVAPTAAIVGAPDTSPEGTAISLTAQVTDPSAVDTAAGFQYAWNVTKNDAPFAAGTSAAFSFTPDDDGVYVVTLTATDKDGGVSNPDARTVTVTNVPPTVTLSQVPASLPEGSTLTATGSFTDPGATDTFTATVDHGDGSGVQPLSIAGQSFALSHTYADEGVYTVTVTVTDDDGGAGTATATVHVFNVPPSVNAGPPATINEGGVFLSSGYFTDPGADTWTASVDYGDGSGAQPLLLHADKTFDLSHLYVQNGAYTVTVAVRDDDGGSGVGTTTVTVDNVPPVVTDLALSATSIFENDSVTLSASFTDPGALDTHSVLITWGDGTTSSLALDAGVYAFQAVHRYLDDDPSGTPSDVYTITVNVTDDSGAVGTRGTLVTVKNVPPAVTSVSGPTAPLLLGSTATVTARFTDVGTLDTHTCSFAWDDGVTTSTPGQDGACASSHTYAATGVYPVTVTVTDDDGGSASQRFEFVVVYDPQAGFVTGGAVIRSPSPAQRAQIELEVRYERGATVPTGQTHFRLDDTLRLDSTAHEWLVISGPNAQLKGIGQLNGVDGAHFLVTGTDTRLGSGRGQDRLRIVIWTDAGTVYDNGDGAPLDLRRANPPEILQGRIAIHR
jgi:hypothetical protein